MAGMPTFASRSQREAENREALRVLRFGAPAIAGVFVVEGLAHLASPTAEPPFLVVPAVAVVVCAGLAVIALRWPQLILAPTWVQLTPWSFVVITTVHHILQGVVTGSVLFLAVALMGVGGLVLAPGPALVAGLITAGTLAWASAIAFDAMPWIYPALVTPMAALLHLSRRQAMLETERRLRTEEQLSQERARIESLRRTRILAAGVAHHFNNLLTVIMGNAEFLAGTDTTHRRELLDVLDAGRRAARLVEEMLAYSGRPVGDSATVVPVQVRLARALELVEAGSVAVRLVAPPALPRIYGSADALARAIANVVANAVEASAAGGEVVVRVSVDRPGWLELEVADRGHGIAPDDRPHVFDPFFTTRGPRRAGLGLAFAQGVAERHGGQIGLHTGRAGTTARIELPLGAT